MATSDLNPELEDKDVDEYLDSPERYPENEDLDEAGGGSDSSATAAHEPYADESHKLYIGREFTPEQFAAWFAVQKLGRLPYNAVGIHHTYQPDENRWRGVRTLNEVFHDYHTNPERLWPKGVGPHLWLYDGTGRYRQGEQLIYVGTHPAHDGIGIYGRNHRWLHIEAIGYFDRKRMSESMEELYRYVLHVVCERRGIPIRDCKAEQKNGPEQPLGLLFHRDAPPKRGTRQKTCPGLETRAEWFYPSMQRSPQRKPAAGQYKVVYPKGVNIRPEPNRDAGPVGALALGAVARYDKAVSGEELEGSPWWLHLQDGRGFVHSSLLERVVAGPNS